MVIFVRMDKIKNTGYELNNWDKGKFFENEKISLLLVIIVSDSN
jgi:hypothetical protein